MMHVVARSANEVIAVGEAKFASEPLGTNVLGLLEKKKALLGQRANAAKLLLFSRSGFDKSGPKHDGEKTWS